ncbi:MAG: penicillin-binding protein 2 [Candidatus Kapabacteria bacterium]|nr:penicillin-binding protein 2 [Candidatus Kapabacteria bacterium]
MINSLDKTKGDYASKIRQNIFFGLTILIFSIFVVRLGYLQLIKGGIYKSATETQSLKQEVVEPFRGNIYDRNNNLLVHGEPSYTVRLTPNDFKADNLPLLAYCLDMDTTTLINILKKNKRYSQFDQIKIARDVEPNKIALIEELGDILQGVDISIETKRLYEFKGNMSHILGYTREISIPQLERYSYYKMGDVIGQTGIEFTYENFLKGTKGVRWVAVDRLGRKSDFNSGKSDIPVNNGFDIKLSVDRDLQEKAEELMTGRRGAIVAIDPSNGEVLCLVSKPDYDLRVFAGNTKNNFYGELEADEEKPLFNRALQAAYPPGSTWKMLVAIAGLNEGLINENTTISCPGSFTYGNRTYGCHGSHGSVNVRKAIQASCNVFFYNLALKIGIEKLGRYGKMFGFGELSKIDLPAEGKGIMPTIEWLDKRYGKGKYPKGNIVNYGIGQGEISVTPLQMAIYTSAIANKGIIYQPHLVRAVRRDLSEKWKNIDYDVKKLGINPKVFDIVIKGMYDVVNTPGGTATNAMLSNIAICGKTGTAQNPHGNDHSWFVCFAPMDNPKIAMCVMVENAGFGATVAAPIARELVNTYLNKPKEPIKDKKLEQAQDTTKNSITQDIKPN